MSVFILPSLDPTCGTTLRILLYFFIFTCHAKVALMLGYSFEFENCETISQRQTVDPSSLMIRNSTS